MLLHSARKHSAGPPTIDSDRDDWWRLARCAIPGDRDMWTADDVWVRVAAAHQCIAHCPVLARCHKEAGNYTWRSTAIGGVVYGLDGKECDVEAPLECPDCKPYRAHGMERRRLQWRLAAQRRRAQIQEAS